jgi:peptidyl-dipeptidase Dcp
MRLYKEQVFNFDEEEVKQYFEFEQTLQGMFDVVEKLFGVVFEERKDSSMQYNETVRVYKAMQEGKTIAYFVGDYFYRPEKRP